MPSSRTDRAFEIFDQAADLPPEKRRAFLLEACGSDIELRREVEGLLSADDTAGAFLSNPQFNPADAAVAMAGAESPGSRIGSYKLLEMIGEGGFGRVFLAEQDRPVKRRVALKIIKLGMDTRQVIARFEAERQALAMMNHPNIARVLDGSATETGRPYFVMELVRGVPITRYCQKNNVKLKDRLKLFVPVCQAIQHAHQKGIIHRDLKPSNVLITLIDGEPVPKIIDFGIAKATQHPLTDRTVYTEFHAFLGTPAYMSPEQAAMSGEDIDTRSDIYSLGVLLYELLTGTTPFDPKTFQNATYAEVQRMIRELDPPKPSTRVWGMRDTVEHLGGITNASELRSTLRGELDWIVMKCLEKPRSRRYDSASALVKDIEAFLAGKPVSAAPPSRWYQMRKFVQRHSIAISSAAAVVTALAIALGVSLASLQRLRVEQQRVLAEKAEADRQRAEAQIAKETAFNVNEFLNDMLASADPEMSRGGKLVTVEQVLMTAAEKIGDRFSDRPLVEAGIRDTIGRAFGSLQRTELAAQHLQIAEDLRRSQGVAKNPDFLTSRAELAIALHSTGKFEPSKALFHEVVDQAERELEQNDGDIVPAVDVLARTSTYIAVPPGRLERLFRMAAERRSKILGEDHPDTLMCRVMLGVHVSSNRVEESEAIFRDTLARMKRVLGPADKFTLRTQDKLATLLRAMDRWDESLAVSLEAARVAEATYGFEHPLALAAWRDHAESLAKMKRYAEALEIENRRLAAMKSFYGPESPNVAAALIEMASLNTRLGNHDEALKLTRQRVELSRKVYGETAMNTLFAEGMLAEELSRRGQIAEALMIFDPLIPQMRKQLRREMPRFVEMKEMYARALYGNDRYEDALAMCRELLQIAESQWADASAPNRVHLARRTAAAAMIMARIRGAVEAETVVQVALQRSEQARLAPSPTTRELVQHLVTACEQTGREDEAARQRLRLAEIDAQLQSQPATQPTTQPDEGELPAPGASMKSIHESIR